MVHWEVSLQGARPVAQCKILTEPRGYLNAVMASYSGDINGTYGPSSATAPLFVSSNCASYCQSCTNSMVGSHFGSKGLLGSISSSWSEADGALPKDAYSNSYDGYGANGAIFPPGVVHTSTAMCFPHAGSRA